MNISYTKVGDYLLPNLKLEDKERYQTVYSKELGSAAAPTACRLTFLM